MYRPPLDPREHRDVTEPTWRSIVVSYAAMAAIPLSLWVASRPLAGGAVLAAVVGLSLGVRHAAKLVRCVRDCQEFAFDLGSTVRITVTQTPTDDPC